MTIQFYNRNEAQNLTRLPLRLIFLSLLYRKLQNIRSGFSLVQILDLCLIIAPVSAFVELYTKHGLDTITVPIAASLILGAASLIL